MKHKDRYPPQWNLIANRIKQKAGYKCQHCGKHHDPPQVILTVHHKDGNTTNNNDSNLIALCRKCHLTEQRKLQAYSSLNTQEELGQTSFIDPKPPYTKPKSQSLQIPGKPLKTTLGEILKDLGI